MEVGNQLKARKSQADGAAFVCGVWIGLLLLIGTRISGNAASMIGVLESLGRLIVVRVGQLMERYSQPTAVEQHERDEHPRCEPKESQWDLSKRGVVQNLSGTAFSVKESLQYTDKSVICSLRLWDIMQIALHTWTNARVRFKVLGMDNWSDDLFLEPVINSAICELARRRSVCCFSY
jgi:hypothetical protein